MIRRAGIVLAAALMAQAAGAVGTENTQPPEQTETTQECAEGEVWDPAQESCVAPENEALNDDIRYAAAREYAYFGAPEAAMRVLEAADPADPRILNYKGFVSRKLGRMAVALEFYEAALATAPDYVLARSYYGQALVEAGDIAGAEAQLAEIRTRAGRDNWPYVALKLALQGKTSGY